jgi:apolipoprotein N-acyltransferase
VTKRVFRSDPRALPEADAPRRIERRAVPRLPNWAGALLAGVAGVAQALSFAPLELWWLQVASLGALVALLANARPGTAALRGWIFGVGWLAAGLWWLYISMHRYGHLPSWLAVLAVAALAALLAGYYAAAAALWARTRRRAVQTDALLFAAWWLLAELARGTFLTGFPWIAGGYAHTTGPLAAWAPYVGVYGLGAMSAWGAALVALGLLGLRNGRWGFLRSLSPLLAPVAVLAVGVVLPADFTRSTGTISVTLVQSNVAQDEKFDAEHIDAALEWHKREFDAAPGQLVVTPESSLPLLPDQIPTETWLAYEQPFQQPGHGAIVGIFLGDEQRGYTNSVIGLDASHRMSDGTFYHYGKRHLLPFGEFVPPGFKWFIEMMQIPIGDQARGTDTAPFAVAGQRVRPLICYEDLFGEDFVGSMVGPQAATLLANVSNLAWFGPLMIQDQHLQFSRMRALEFQRGQVRATNTGATAVIDWHGRVTHRLPPFVEGRLDAHVEGRTGDTPYARWLSQWGLWPLWLLAAAVVLASRFVRRR